MLRSVPLLFLCVVLTQGGDQLCAEPADDPDGQETNEEEQTQPWWRGTFGKEISLVSIDRTIETDPSDEDLRGVRLAFRSWQDYYDDMLGMGGGGFYLGKKEGREQDVIDLGVELSLMNIAAGPVRFGPRFRLGLEHRDSEPHRGTGGVGAVGFQIAVWLGRRIQIAVLWDREFGFESGTRNQLAFSFRFAVMSSTS